LPAARDVEPIDGPGAAEPALEREMSAVERELRNELANASNPTAAALELAGLLAESERHAEALAVLTTAQRRSTDPVLRVAAAGLQRDLGQRHTAVATLVALRAEQGALSLHPSLLFELAELQWLEGTPAAAVATLAELQQAHAGSAWVADQQVAIRGLQGEIDSGRPPSRLRVRDLLGNLRGADSPWVRQRTLEELVHLADGAAGGQSRRLQGLRDRAIAIGCGDADATVRARAIQLATPADELRLPFCAAALADVDPRVRAIAAERTAQLRPDGGAALLCAALQREADPAAFRAMHDALAQNVPGGPELPSGAEVNPDQRRAAAAAWKDRCKP
jgi:hypothetical protein